MDKIKQVLKNKIVQTILCILIASFVLEGVIVCYNMVMKKLFSKYHMTNNETIEIKMEDTNIYTADGKNYIEIKGLNNQEIYNISLNMKDKSIDVYLRVLFNNDAKFIPKENKDATKYKVYFLSGMQTSEFKLEFPENTIDIDNIDDIHINDNIDYMPNSGISFIRIIAMFLIMLSIYLAVICIKKLNKKEYKFKTENLFLFLSLSIGLVFVFVNLPQARYDEHAHFWRAYELSNGYIASNINHEYPKSIKKLFENEDGSYPNKNMTYNTIKEKLSENLNKEDKQQMAVGATAGNSPISYVPQTIGVFLGRKLNLQPIIILWIGRIFNLLAYSLIIYFSIKIMPNKKWKMIWLLIGIFPMSITLAASLSPDAIILSWTLLAISYVMKLKYEDKNVNIKQIILLGILFMIPAMCKIVYAPLILLILIIPKEKFKDEKNRILAFIICILLIILPYIGIKHMLSSGNGEIALRTNLFENILFVVSDPIRTIGTMVLSLYTETSTWLFEMIGGYNTAIIISIFIFILMLLTAFKSEPEEEKYKLNKKDKIIIALIICTEIAAVVGGLYVSWTEAKQTIVDGVQGRYFLPVIPLIMMVLSNGIFKLNIKNEKLKTIFAILIMYITVIIYTVTLSI